MMNAALMTESYRLLNQARMIAEAPAAQAVIGRRHPSSQEPPGAWAFHCSTLEACGERINLAIAHHSDAELTVANAWCARELESLTHAALRSPETPAEFRVRICVQYEGQLAGVVARAEMTTVTTVRKFRVMDGRDARTGRPAASVVPTDQI